MAVRLESVSANQTLRLIFKAVISVFFLHWLRAGSFSFWVSLMYVLVFAILYFIPPLNNGRFAPSAILLLVVPFFIPLLSGRAEFLFLVLWTAAFTVLLGVKNLVLIQRQNFYRVVHFAIIAVLGSILLERFSLASEALIFVGLLFLFREFYLTGSSSGGEKPALIAALEALLFIQISWVLSFLSIDVVVGGAFLTLFTFIFHDTTANRIENTLTKSVIIRNVILFGSLTLLILILSIKGSLS